MRPSQFDQDELARGMAVELEHTDDRALATEIAMDHLVEDPMYYRKLALLENPLRPPIRNGACVVIVRAGRVLAITHGHDHANLNLPGGGVEAGESFGQAAVRELMEETQVDGSAATLIPVHHRRGALAESVAFAALGDLRFPPMMFSRPFEGFVRWCAPADLLMPTCTHARSNLVTFSRLGLI